ncbi:multidrug effflux MFS transporter [Tropicimonas sp. TH_r6]|uniref:multidrug effflux MFS transporter n=1 Tax=Tropicimonas sp. TH_r6 TaxID=3082085 RepID=UPI0029534FDC|nr:multidrug effflux MFS transporter [Tropicimonas sp. TH_r6]MDV7143585.1 multidrug effflux MFS transporter [Tropicimonas sp. TH_r6]
MTEETVPGSPAQPSGTRLSKPEFVAMMALLMAIVAFSTDAMLPAFPEIAGTLSPGAPNRVQLMVTFFLLGMGIGTIFAGPISDAWGRKPVILGGTALYIAGAAVCWQADSLDVLLAGRILQGLGAAAPRTVSMAMMRDLYSGRQMAQIGSLIMMIFAIFPAIAPTFGAQVIALAGWRAIFITFVLVASTGALWLWIRQSETLPETRRTPLRPKSLWKNTRKILSMRVVLIAITVQSLALGTLFAMLSSVQQIFDITYGRGEYFHFWFAGIAILAGSSGVLNAAYVNKLGMRFIIRSVLIGQICLSSVSLLLLWSGALLSNASFVVFLVFSLGVFFQNGLIMGNSTALAMEPLGHLAGLASSAMGAIGTIVAVLIAIPIGQAFNGTAIPMVTGALVLACLSRLAMRSMPERA